MKKISHLIAVAAILLYSAASHARICFLADLSCQEAGFASENQCSIGGPQNCPQAKNYTLVCEDSRGKHYRDDGCQSGWCNLNNLSADVRDNYTFTSRCEECVKGATCKVGFTQCDNKKHINTTSNPQGPICYSLGDNCQINKEQPLYWNCKCHSRFSITEDQCKGEGLKLGDFCVDADKGTLYDSCACADGWQDSKDGNCKYGAEKTAHKPDGSSCYKCRTEPGCDAGETYVSTQKYDCNETNQTPSFRRSGDGWCASCVCKDRTSDFDAFWKQYYAEPSNATPANTCAMGQGKIEYNCEKLGYDTGKAITGKKCSDGTEPYRCPFDHEQVYCASGISGDLTLPITCPTGYNTYQECVDMGRAPLSLSGQTYNPDDCVQCAESFEPDTCDLFDCSDTNLWTRLNNAGNGLTYYQNVSVKEPTGSTSGTSIELLTYCVQNDRSCSPGTNLRNQNLTWDDPCLEGIILDFQTTAGDLTTGASLSIQQQCELRRDAYDTVITLYENCCHKSVAKASFRCNDCHTWPGGHISNCNSSNQYPPSEGKWCTAGKNGDSSIF